MQTSARQGGGGRVVPKYTNSIVRNHVLEVQRSRKALSRRSYLVSFILMKAQSMAPGLCTPALLYFL